MGPPGSLPAGGFKCPLGEVRRHRPDLPQPSHRRNYLVSRLRANGHVGPLAVTQQATLSAAFRTALDLAAQSGAPHLSALLPGPCEAALAVALAAGMRITNPMVLMATRDFGNWSQYQGRIKQRSADLFDLAVRIWPRAAS
jgi:hypothetical protein